MSYARLMNEDSDVYIFGSNKLEVHYACKLNLEAVYFEYDEKPALLKHLTNIQKFGIKVPKHCMSRLKKK